MTQQTADLKVTRDDIVTLFISLGYAYRELKERLSCSDLYPSTEDGFKKDLLNELAQATTIARRHRLRRMRRELEEISQSFYS